MRYLLEAAVVAGIRFEASVVAEVADLNGERMLEALDRAEQSRLVRQLPGEFEQRYAFTHALLRDTIYDELPRGRRVRYHHRIAVATERAHQADLGSHVGELALHFYMGAELGDADKALHYSRAAGVRAMRVLAFEESAIHYTRALEVLDRFGPKDPEIRCDVLVALAEAEARAGVHDHADECLTQAAEFGAPHGRRGAPDHRRPEQRVAELLRDRHAERRTCTTPHGGARPPAPAGRRNPGPGLGTAVPGAGRRTRDFGPGVGAPVTRVELAGSGDGPTAR